MNGNAIFSSVSGLFFVITSHTVAKFIGIDAPLAILLTAVFSDSAWVLLSLLLLVTGWVQFSGEGKWAVGIVTMIVDVFATLQFIEWRKM